MTEAARLARNTQRQGIRSHVRQAAGGRDRRARRGGPPAAHPGRVAVARGSTKGVRVRTIEASVRLSQHHRIGGRARSPGGRPARRRSSAQSGAPMSSEDGGGGGTAETRDRHPLGLPKAMRTAIDEAIARGELGRRREDRMGSLSCGAHGHCRGGSEVGRAPGVRRAVPGIPPSRSAALIEGCQDCCTRVRFWLNSPTCDSVSQCDSSRWPVWQSSSGSACSAPGRGDKASSHRGLRTWLGGWRLVRSSGGMPALGAVLFSSTMIGEVVVRAVRKHGDPTPVTANDLWHIGSLTKAFTSTLAGRFC